METVKVVVPKHREFQRD